MNQLSKRPTKPDFKFILEEHQEDFMDRVVQTYVRNSKSLTEPPNISGNLMHYMMLEKKEPFVAAYLAAKHQDHDYFSRYTASLTEQEKFIYTKEASEQYLVEEEPQYDTAFHLDIRSVLMFYNMSFADVFDYTDMQAEISDEKLYYYNVPFTKVW